ncbi:MAG: multidrug transporter [Deltaproteobacteria bacterium]|nr:multidrug transporter [Deltaproteobacteria bacterium]MBW1923577.1 multidrug transporter [Deltaproteobacteria bacterium]MBW1948569.1 multidrug transporter [Deltaproteobacteria bacterium]MBW2006755.1 multidrug transporter [Deltaproteobacteria bacterium]MBW2101680.1 multidrug transporter [Deltaproteobacteria bacterium]
MRNKAIRLIVFMLVLVWASTAPAQPPGPEDPPTTVAIIGDLAVVRPLSIVGTALGGAAFVVALPFSLAAGNTGEIYERLVKDPMRYTFTRPLGSNALGSVLTSPIYSTGTP